MRNDKLIWGGPIGSNLPLFAAYLLLTTLFAIPLLADDPQPDGEVVEAEIERAGAASLVPEVTKSFISIADFAAVQAAWEKTQFGKLMKDPSMEDFVNDLDRQIDEKLTETGSRLGLSWADIRDVYGGEICFATMQPPGEKPTENYAMGVLVDVTGKAMPLDVLLKKIDANMEARKATRAESIIEGAKATVYELPRKPRVRVRQKAIILVKDNWLLAIDNEQMAADIVKRITGNGVGKSLADTEPYQEVMKRSAKLAKESPQHVRFFIEPFGMAEVARAARQAGRRSRVKKTDRLAAFRRQGFSAVEGVGGQIAFSAGEKDVLYHAYVYSPKEKRVKAAAMLDFPNNGHSIPAWIPEDAGTLAMINWKLLKAFDSLEPLVNEMLGEDVWQEIIDSIEKDRNGPQVNLRNDLVAHLKDQISVVSDIKQPIDGNSERIAIIAELKDSGKVEETIKKTFQNDPHATPTLHKGKTIYRIYEEGNRDRLLNRMSLVVYREHLIVGTSNEYIIKLMDTAADGAFQKTKAYVDVEAALKGLGANGDAAKGVNNAERAYLANYELIRTNSLPGAKTLLGKMMDRMYPTGDEAVKRKPRIDGSKLPPFEKVKKFFRPSGFFVRADDTGWNVIGCVLP